jgi:NAD(P)-dependent dehydrogenase (short-subunit alcohol dehydrogenase family)
VSAAAGRGAVVVTGASTGIGRAAALRLDREGFTVFAGVRKLEDGESVRAEASERLEPVIIDVTDEAAIADTARLVGEATGGRLAGLVNNAGITVQGPVEALPLDDYRRQLEVNVIGQIAVTQALLANIRAARGRVVFISSIGGRGGLPYLSPYNASKAAIGAVADSLRGEMRQFGVEVSYIEPGAIATEIWDKAVTGAPALRESLGPQMIDLYGPKLDQLAALAKKTGDGGLPPDAVADVILHALTASRPKARYVVGTEAKVTAALRTYLPKRVFDRLVERRIESA